MPSGDVSHDQFIRLYSTAEASVRRYAKSLLADWNAVDDVMQEASVAMLNKFDQYDPSQPFVAWACRFAYFEVLKHRKRNRRDRHYSDRALEALAATPVHTDSTIEARRSALLICLGKLPAEDRELIQLRYATSRTLREVSSAIDVPATRMYKRLAIIRRQLMSCVNQATRQELRQA